MLTHLSRRFSYLSQPLLVQAGQFNFSQGATFLNMVENFFDRAALHTGIRADRLAYYKKAENVLKCSIPLFRGTFALTQMMDLSKLSLHIDANTRHTNCPAKGELGTLRMWTLRKLRLWPASWPSNVPSSTFHTGGPREEFVLILGSTQSGSWKRLLETMQSSWLNATLSDLQSMSLGLMWGLDLGKWAGWNRLINPSLDTRISMLMQSQLGNSRCKEE